VELVLTEAVFFHAWIPVVHEHLVSVFDGLLEVGTEDKS
jgi:hypothetical protein